MPTTTTKPAAETEQSDTKPTAKKTVSKPTKEAPTRESINAKLSPIEVHGNPYVPVTQRILGFWELYPEGSIITELLSDSGDKCVVKASVLGNNGRVIATGHAYEVKGKGVNANSYVENCETSAVGRALGILGIGSTESIASADEMANVYNKVPPQEPEKPIPQGAEFIGKCRSCGKRYTFPSGTTRDELRATECCNRPDWVVE